MFYEWIRELITLNLFNDQRVNDFTWNLYHSIKISTLIQMINWQLLNN